MLVLDAAGTPLRRDARDGLRIPVALDAIAPIARTATIAAEDARFHSHPGVDPIAITRALVLWRREGPSGASTITQQLARRLYLADSRAPAVVRKLHEAWIAMQVEARHSKDEILEAYLNEVYYGHNAYGIEAAAQTYFGVSARELDLAQATLLVGLPRTPAELDPVEHPEAARARQQYVLDRLVRVGAISQTTAEEALAVEVTVRADSEPQQAPHFALYALDEAARMRPDLVGTPGLVIETTLDSGLTREAARLASAHLRRLAGHSAGNAAVVAIDPRSGAVVAFVGGVDFDEQSTGQVNLALAPRQPGSALKPFLYASALERGYTAASELLDVPTTFQTATGPYAPLDSDSRFRGPVSMRVALASSLNIPAVRMLDSLGVEAFLDVTGRAGLASLRESEQQGLTLALGSGDVSLLDLTAAYQVFGAAGERHEPFAVARIRDARGRILYAHAPTVPTRAIAAEHAFIVADMLSDPLAREPGFGTTSAFVTAARTGVKTGTTSGGRDVWAVGFTPERVVGVWVGNADGAPMREISSVTGALPIWRAVIDTAVSTTGSSWPEPPSSVAAREICPLRGDSSQCADPMSEWFVRGTEPGNAVGAPPSVGSHRADPGAERQAWAGASGAVIARPEYGTSSSVHIVQPADRSVFYLAPELPENRMLVRATAPLDADAVEFRIDGELVAVTPPAQAELVVPLQAGRHELRVEALGPRGATFASVTFEVLRR